jgi:hypothetical protein
LPKTHRASLGAGKLARNARARGQVRRPHRVGRRDGDAGLPARRIEDVEIDAVGVDQRRVRRQELVHRRKRARQLAQLLASAEEQGLAAHHRLDGVERAAVGGGDEGHPADGRRRAVERGPGVEEGAHDHAAEAVGDEVDRAVPSGDAGHRLAPQPADEARQPPRVDRRRQTPVVGEDVDRRLEPAAHRAHDREVGDGQERAGARHHVVGGVGLAVVGEHELGQIDAAGDLDLGRLPRRPGRLGAHRIDVLQAGAEDAGHDDAGARHSATEEDDEGHDRRHQHGGEGEDLRPRERRLARDAAGLPVDQEAVDLVAVAEGGDPERQEHVLEARRPKRWLQLK